MSLSCVLLSCGSFNPITVMHLRMFEIAKYHLKKKGITVSRGIISPTNDNYAIYKPSLSPAFHRLAMINLALRGVEGQWIICDDWETKQTEWIRTLPALKHYQTTHSQNIKLLCGADLIESFLVPNLWSDEHIGEILQSFGVVVIPREGSDIYKLLYKSSKSDIFRKYIDQIDVIDEHTHINVSSTMVRDAVREGKPIDHLVHRDVAMYIRNNNLYKY